MTGMERLIVPIEWKASEDGSGTLEGYASTFGNVDLGLDVAVPGAFKKTSARINAEGVPLLADHVASVASVLGTVFYGAEDRKGWKIKANFSSAQSAQDVKTKLVEGHVGKLSIGYEATKVAYEQREGKTVRLLQEVKVWEVSVVVFPMNPEAVVQRVKSIADALDGDARAALAAEIAEKSTANEVRDGLNSLVREAYGADGVDLWIRDWDDEKVWFTEMSPDESNTYEQSYSSDDEGRLALTGERIKVRPVTSYVPDVKATTITDNPGRTGEQSADEADEGDADEAAQEQAGDDPAGGATDEGAHWDHWASEAILNGTDPDATANPADVAGLRTLLELNETALGLGSADTESE